MRNWLNQSNTRISEMCDVYHNVQLKNEMN